jgi:hypothetical protein
MTRLSAIHIAAPASATLLKKEQPIDVIKELLQQQDLEERRKRQVDVAVGPDNEDFIHVIMINMQFCIPHSCCVTLDIDGYDVIH